MDDSILIQNMNVSFRGKGCLTPVVKDVNTVFPSGTITGLIGESGSGKSVLGMSILQLLPGTAQVSGQCLFRGRDLYRLSEREMCAVRGQEIGLIPQNPSQSLNPIYTVGRQLVESMTVHDRSQKAEARARRDMLLGRFGFPDPHGISRSYSFRLSGGMNQRVISAMGLMNKPSWIIADEPTKGLDAILRRQVYHVLRQISESETRGMIVITHDIALAGALSQRLLVLYKGMILEEGPTEAVLANPLHPYTVGLMRSLPENGMHPIPRADPALAEKCTGCSFAPRCAWATERCCREVPPDVRPESDRKVRCFRYA